MKSALKILVTPNENEFKNYLRIFLLAGIISVIIFLPFLIFYKGVFLLYGDYNVQQIPFYQLAHDAVRNGDFGWNWKTDLGANFVASYSFYLLGSPFFWLTIPFPNEFLPYLMTPLLILKISIAALTSYAFIRRFVKTPHMAFIGALLYAFSGFSIYNIFYNHFHEIIAFFPLMLIAMEELMINNKKGLFALTVALNLLISYYFFVPSVVFLIIYFCFRCFTGGFKISPQSLICISIESILGVMMGIILFIPSALMVMQNPRVSSLLFGYDMLFYNNIQKYGLLIHSLFFPPDMPAFPNFFPDSDAKWYSVAAYLPMFGMSGVISFIRAVKKSWIKYILITLFVMMFIPILNSAFNGFNSSFYTRWFYILTLMMALATAISLEKKNINLGFGIKFCFILILSFSLIGIFPKKQDDNIIFFQMPKYPIMFWLNIAIALSGIVLTHILIKKRNTGKFYNSSIYILCGFICICSIAQLTHGSCCGSYEAYQDIVERGLNCRFDLDEKDFYRVDTFSEQSTDNWPMFWKKPSIQAFQSTVPSSIMTFYINLGTKRDVASRVGHNEYFGLRHFLSVKYIILHENLYENLKGDPIPPGFEFQSHQNEFDIYENKNFVPMGFAMDQYIDSKTWKETRSLDKDRLLLKGVLLTDEQKAKYKNFLTPVSEEQAAKLSKENLLSDANMLKRKCCENFSHNSYEFTADISLEKENLVVFTVPYESGWTATVNGAPAEIENVDSGMMAVKCSKGENKIHFEYKTPGLIESFIIMILGIFLYILYIIVSKKLAKSNPSRFGSKNLNQ